jgi:energy-converting hydrogenase B subunit D
MTPEPLVLGFMLGMTAVVVFANRLITALIGLSLFSMLLTLMYVLLHAPDVALTEAALGVGLSTLVFLIAIRKTEDDRHD